MKTMNLILFMIVIFISPLPATDFPNIKGWKPVSEVLSYNPDNLYEYINGAADQFIAYGFQELVTCDLSSKDLQVTIDIYDLGTRLNAFGMYKTERPRGQKILAIGTEAYVSPPYQCLLFKENYYVKVNAFEGEITNDNGRPLLEAIAKALPGEVGHPSELQLLPSTGKIPDSESFTRQAFLGLTELNNCVYANYKNGEKEFKYFVIIVTGKETKESIWKRLSEKWKKVDQGKFPVLTKKIPYTGISGTMLTDRKIIGVTDCGDESEMLKRLKAVIGQ
ncbi:MAG: hypothetical protein JSW07_09415 [bacterium]|nr:MAG: hypothetical protein JSW07_09415 [bacterium]